MIDKNKLLAWLESEMKEGRLGGYDVGYTIALKWTAYNLEKGLFDEQCRCGGSGYIEHGNGPLGGLETCGCQDDM